MPDQFARDSHFHALHAGPILTLPNAWDAASARIVQEAGAKAVATSSAALAWSLGHADGHHLPFEKLRGAVANIARVISVPLSVDFEAGYSDDPNEVAENVAVLIGEGAVGINLEDGREPHDLHLRKIEAVRAAAEHAGVNLFINARTDVYLKKLVPPEDAVAETLRRAKAFKSAGASGLFAPAVAAPDEIKALAADAGLPLNVLPWPGLPAKAELERLGVARLSAGTAIASAAYNAAREAAVEYLDKGDAALLSARRGPAIDYNAYFK